LTVSPNLLALRMTALRLQERSIDSIGMTLRDEERSFPWVGTFHAVTSAS
jgi:hypothetical protein